MFNFALIQNGIKNKINVNPHKNTLLKSFLIKLVIIVNITNALKTKYQIKLDFLFSLYKAFIFQIY